MKTAKYVADLISDLDRIGTAKAEACWRVALACVGWAYVFGARGDYCDPSNRASRARSDHPTIIDKCQALNGTKGTCTGCKWYPGMERTRCFDCRGFTYWVLKYVAGIELSGGGATSQWNTAKNWAQQGTIDTMPANRLCCLFVKNGSRMEHTGFGLNDETVECSSGVQHFTTRNKKWTHWAIPSGLYSDQEKPPVLKKGSKGVWVTKLQTLLSEKGYDLGPMGIDGDFGKATQKAVEAFQGDNFLPVDGIVGEETWAELDPTEGKHYTVRIPHLTEEKAEALRKKYPGAEVEEEK